ncbi:unnamed protein product [Cochlearia groenlandica]
MESSAQKLSVCAQEKIVITNSHNEKLVGLLHETGSREIVVLCHGFKSNKKDKSISNVASALEKEGITAFRFDFSGNGYVFLFVASFFLNFRDASPWLCCFRESEGDFYYGNYIHEADDLHSVIQHFSNTNRVVTVILGHSKGGDVVLLYASKYHNVPNVINLSGRYHMEKGIAERLGDDFLERIKKEGFIDVKGGIVNCSSAFPTSVSYHDNFLVSLLKCRCFFTGRSGYRVTEESLMERLNTDMHEASLKIDKECMVLTIHGSEDELIPVEDAKEFAKIIPNHKLEIVEGADHSYTKHQSEMVSKVVEFVKAVIAKNN